MSDGVIVSAPPEAWEDAEDEAGGLLDEWAVVVGTQVAADEHIASLMVVKTSFSVVSPVAGTLIEQLVKAGDNVERDQPLAVVRPDGAWS